jgi:hypothetical protein
MSLAVFMPKGALLFVESVNFGPLVHGRENSKDKEKWLASDRGPRLHQTVTYRLKK